MLIEHTNLFHSKALFNLPKVGILVLKTFHLATLHPLAGAAATFAENEAKSHRK
jgi:hypothetical protein